MSQLLNTGIKQSFLSNIGLSFNHVKPLNHPRILFKKNVINLNNIKRNFSVTPQVLNTFTPYNITKDSKYKVFEGKNPQPINFKFYYIRPENSDTGVVSLLSAEQIKGKTLKKEGIIGWIQFEKEDVPVIEPRIFAENKEFYEIFNRVIKENLHTDINKKCQMDAQFHKNGWMYFKDDRNKINYGRLESAEDTFGAVEVKDCEFIPKSFQSTFTYRLLTRRGLFQLPEALHNKLVEEIQNTCLE
ncbi:hypothetical protein BCR36DRAFT_410461 [Piromyces finnis]|uniref:Uncharacterized protein n=1 Tax=Piromyces finnis TaxID=1754191 RepID=A0A1Y1VEW0_9FUNG|nr:hypothetical protein BCR36DRAFT_410461 [Piromyces finnis]|eukprot:ORX54653.1 hypothetical protein BCR36DRAFT_410461 [Piromyces finnis]